MKILRSVFRRDNILILLLIAGAILGVFGVPQVYGIDFEKTVLSLLGVLALDFLLERVTYLDRIEKRLDDFSDRLDPNIGLRNRPQLPDFAVALDSSSTVWLCGRALTGLLEAYGRQMTSVVTKKKIRVLLVDPNNQGLPPFFEQQGVPIQKNDERPDGYRQAVNNWQALADSVPNNQIEVRILDYIPIASFAYFNCSGQGHGEVVILVKSDKIEGYGQKTNVFSSNNSTTETTAL